MPDSSSALLRALKAVYPTESFRFLRAHSRQPHFMFTNPHVHPVRSLVLPWHDQAQRAKNLILLIGDGMGAAHLSAGLAANRGQLYLTQFQDIGFATTHSAHDFITDSAAAATAIATGHKTYNGGLGMDAHMEPQPNLREMAMQRGMATGVIASCSVTEATPAAFVAHQPGRMFHEDIAEEYLDSGIDFFLGEGRPFFAERSDERNLLPCLAERGYHLVEDLAQLAQIERGRVAGLLPQMPRYSQGRDDMLRIGGRHALRLLSQNPQGFFLMIESSQIDWGAHDNDADYVVEEMLDFDQLVGEMLAFAVQDGETLVVVTADHETGGLALTDGNREQGKVEASFTTTMHTGEMVPVLACGPQAHCFRGFYDNCALFHKMLAALQGSRLVV